MSGGQNQKFMADPAGYARGKVILLPIHGDDVGFWGKVQKGPFDLVEVSKSGFPGTVVALTHMTLRGKEQTDRTQPIEGVWIPYKDGDYKDEPVLAKGSSYFVFTTRLGGCAVGIRDLNSADTIFSHDARSSNQQKNHLADYAVKLLPGQYDPVGESSFDAPSINVTAFFWWNGTKWQLGQSATYDAQEAGQKLVHADDKYPLKTGAAPGK